MDQRMELLSEKRAQLCIKNLRDHQFGADYFASRQEAVQFLKNQIPEGASVALGGSVTLTQCGILDWLQDNPHVHHIDRYNTDDVAKALHDAFSADVYLMSTNAVTLDGQLYNIDGNGNRVAALTYGPKQVYVLAGVNKIVDDLEEAEKRARNIAAPANNLRLGKDNPCTAVGRCMNCNRDTCICSTYVITRRSQTKGRIHVLLINETLGY